jgi:hypothetical protein
MLGLARELGQERVQELVLQPVLGLGQVLALPWRFACCS